MHAKLTDFGTGKLLDEDNQRGIDIQSRLDSFIDMSI
jgi:hypothetical protein